MNNPDLETKEQEIELNPCPKCKSQDVVCIEDKGTYFVTCYDCNAITKSFRDSQTAKLAWNLGITLNRKQRRLK